jgi:hypothetical protein
MDQSWVVNNRTVSAVSASRDGVYADREKIRKLISAAA